MAYELVPEANRQRFLKYQDKEADLSRVRESKGDVV